MSAYSDLKSNLDKLPDHLRIKAESLLSFMDLRGSWSEKQFSFAESLARQATQPKAEALPAVAPRFSRIVEIFRNAMAKAGRDAAKDTDKRPTLYLATSQGARFVAKLAGASSRNPGHVNVAAKEFGAGFWGRIDPQGVWYPGRQDSTAGDTMLADVEATLDAIQADARGALNVQSVAIGVCACCGRTLTAKESVARGVGPICAERWGL